MTVGTWIYFLKASFFITIKYFEDYMAIRAQNVKRCSKFQVINVKTTCSNSVFVINFRFEIHKVNLLQKKKIFGYNSFGIFIMSNEKT